MSENSPFPPASEGPVRPSTPPPSEKKLGKRPMTGAQLQRYYSKLPRTEDYDSDGEREPLRTSSLVNRTNIPGLQLGLPVHPAPPAQFSPVRVAPEDEHARDLLEALNQGPPRPGTPPGDFIASDGNRTLTITELANLFEVEDANNNNDPGRLVPDPFMPDNNPRITAAERDAIVQCEQEWRIEQGTPLLVQDPDDDDHWMDPAEVHDIIVNAEVSESLEDDDIYD